MKEYCHLRSLPVEMDWLINRIPDIQNQIGQRNTGV